MSDLPVAGKIVIGEGEQDEVSVLYIGEELGRGGPRSTSPSIRSKV